MCLFVFHVVYFGYHQSRWQYKYSTYSQIQKYFSFFFIFVNMEQIKPKVGRTKLPENQKKRLVSAYLTDEEKNLILAKYGNLSNAVRAEILEKIIQNGHSHPTWDGIAVA